ncbi:MAG: chemotaxis protein CheD [Planctomycetota bacterium]|nr:chemotaxis protein CheD [Planctomycetota bacterium]
MKEIVDVYMGQVKLGRGDVMLRSLAIGSCIAIAAYDFKLKIGAMAHVMLPGSAPEKSSEINKYAPNAIDAMIDLMVQAHSDKSNIEVCLVGAGNVLQKEDDAICDANIRSTTRILEERNIPIRATALGGMERKSISLDIETGSVTYRKGDGQKQLLWRPATSQLNDTG